MVGPIPPSPDDRGPVRTVRFRAAAVASGALALAGCGGVDVSSASAPAGVSDGSYAYLASSAPGNAPAALLTIDGDTLTLTGEAGAVTTTTGEPATPLTIGSVHLAAPALFGDCGQTTPKRVTLVDLDSYDEAGGPFGFTRWVELCDTSDADCPSAVG